MDHPDEMARAMHALDFLAKFLDEIKKIAKEQVEDDDIEIPGYTLIESNSGITCSDPDGIYQVAVLGQNLPVAEFHECIRTISVGKLVKKLAAHTAPDLGMSVAAADRHWRKEFMDDGIISPGTSYTYLKKSND